jgi:hypothetical protein
VTTYEEWDPTSGTVRTTHTGYSWDASGLIIDIFAFAILTMAFATTVERWRRDERPWQFSVQSVLVVMTAAAVVLFIFINEFSVYWWLSDVINGGY